MIRSDTRYTRRDALRLAGGSMLALSAAVTSRGAIASHAWCRTDPVIMVNGEIADVFVSGPLDAPLLVTGPTEIVVSVPVGVDAHLIASDLGFGKGEVVTFVESEELHTTAAGIELKIAVLVPASDDTMPVKVEFAPRIVGILAPEEVLGTANTWVILDTVF